MAQPTMEDEGDLWRRLSREEKKRKTQEAWAASLILEQTLLRRAEEARAAAIAAAAAASSSYGVPAPMKAICELYAPTWGETSSEDRRGGCVVCLEALETGQELRMMPCRHSFHERCIFKWLVVNGVCPICQFVLPSQEAA